MKVENELWIYEVNERRAAVDPSAKMLVRSRKQDKWLVVVEVACDHCTERNRYTVDAAQMKAAVENAANVGR